MDPKYDLRRKPRIVCDHNLTVVWRDASGYEKYATTSAKDISESGLRMQLPEPLPKMQYLLLRASKLGLCGNASVRYCVRVASNQYSVGVEFTSGMRWKPKNGPIPLAN